MGSKDFPAEIAEAEALRRAAGWLSVDEAASTQALRHSSPERADDMFKEPAAIIVRETYRSRIIAGVAAGKIRAIDRKTWPARLPFDGDPTAPSFFPLFFVSVDDINTLERTEGSALPPLTGTSERESMEQRQDRRLQRLRELGGDMVKERGGWKARGVRGVQAKLIAEEKAARRPMCNGKNVREDLQAAASRREPPNQGIAAPSLEAWAGSRTVHCAGK